MYIPFAFTTSNQLITEGLVYWLAPDTYSGSIWYDNSGNDNNALLSGSNLIVSASSSPLSGTGWYFNGTTNYLTFPQPLNNSPSGAFTIQWYAGLDSPVNNNYYVYGKESPTNGWDIMQNDVGTSSDFVITDVPGQNFKANIGAISTMYLHTITVTEPVGGFSKATYYINVIGDTMFPIVMKKGTDTNFPYNGFNASSAPLRFAFDSGVGGISFKGPVSNLFLYNRALNQEELTNNLLFLIETGYQYV